MTCMLVSTVHTTVVKVRTRKERWGTGNVADHMLVVQREREEDTLIMYNN